MKAIRLMPKENALYHFGINSIENTEFIFHSDSLFSAIINNLIKINGEDYDLKLAEFPLISSLFPYIELKDKQIVYFLPKPYSKINFKNHEEYSKKIKKIKFISINALKLINENYEFNEGCIKSEIFLFSPNEVSKIDKKFRFFEKVKEVKVRVKRSEKNNEPYIEEHFKIIEKGGGFYFLVNGELSNDLIKAIHLIKDEGLGGERSCGKGLFNNIKIDEINIESKGKHYLSLSLIAPKNDEYKSALNFNLIKRKGYVFSPFCKSIALRKNPIIMFTEGSIFNSKIKGNIPTVVEKNYLISHNVYRYGKAFLIKFGGVINEN